MSEPSYQQEKQNLERHLRQLIAQPVREFQERHPEVFISGIKVRMLGEEVVGVEVVDHIFL